MSTARGSIRPAEDLSRLERHVVLRVWKCVVCCCWWLVWFVMVVCSCGGDSVKGEVKVMAEVMEILAGTWYVGRN